MSATGGEGDSNIGDVARTIVELTGLVMVAKSTKQMWHLTWGDWT